MTTDHASDRRRVAFRGIKRRRSSSRTRPGFGFVSLQRSATERLKFQELPLSSALSPPLGEKNIAKFGGSAASVTLVGTSGAGRDVMALDRSPVFPGSSPMPIVISGADALTKPDPAARIDDSLARLAFEDRKAGTVGLRGEVDWGDSPESPIGFRLLKLPGFSISRAALDP